VGYRESLLEVMMEKPIHICFADLSHTGKTVHANYFPLAGGFIAAYASEYLGPEISVEIFKYPKNLTTYLQTVTPGFACFSNYSWCFQLNYEYALRIKQKHPETITVFGGPNYPTEASEQEEFLRCHPAIDFYVDGEGELAFVELYKNLADSNFDVEGFKKKGILSPNTHYTCGERFFRGEMLPRIRDVNIIPSPFLNGMFDKFFDPILTPLIQTQRGCPYSCVFCHDGIRYMSKVSRFSQDRINNEITYICDRHMAPNLSLADLNFGIFKEDIETAKLLSELQEKHGWPKFIDSSVAKNHKERAIEIANTLKGGFYLGASVQSTDPEVLENIQRSNVNLDQLTGMATASIRGENPSFSEIILCLPGDTKEKHMKSVFDMVDIGIEEIRMYQFTLLFGTEGNSRQYRKQFGYETRFRILPLCFGDYKAFDEPFDVFEYQEVCVGNKTMPHEEYQECRKFDLMIEIFNNGGFFKELFLFLKRYGICPSDVFKKLHSTLQGSQTFSRLFGDFMADEEKNFWSNENEVKAFLLEPGIIEKYKSGEYGANQIMEFRALALMEYMEDVASALFDVAKGLLDKKGFLDENISQYLEELLCFVVLKKGDIFATGSIVKRKFHYDFVKLSQLNFKEDPFNYRTTDSLEICFSHPGKTAKAIKIYQKQYGHTASGFGQLLLRVTLPSLFREVRYA